MNTWLKVKQQLQDENQLINQKFNNLNEKFQLNENKCVEFQNEISLLKIQLKEQQQLAINKQQLISSESDDDINKKTNLKQARLTRKTLKQLKTNGSGRSSSSTPDSIAFPSSVSSSGISSLNINNLNINSDSKLTKNLFKSARKILHCHKKVNSLIGFMNRILNGTRPSKNEILGSNL